MSCRGVNTASRSWSPSSPRDETAGALRPRLPDDDPRRELAPRQLPGEQTDQGIHIDVGGGRPLLPGVVPGPLRLVDRAQVVGMQSGLLEVLDDLDQERTERVQLTRLDVQVREAADPITLPVARQVDRGAIALCWVVWP